MNPITHLLLSWQLAEVVPALGKRGRMLVTVAGVIPDLDGLGMGVELLTRNRSHPLLWFSEYHHVLCHNAGFAAFVTAASWLAAKRRWLTAFLVALSFHLHLLYDIIGARGPDGEQWPIPYLLPFSDRWQWTWSHQWPLNAWPNIVITLIALSATFYLAWRRGYSPLEIFSPRADGIFIATLRHRFPRQSGTHS